MNITKKYITSIYDLDAERKTKILEKIIGSLSIESGEYTKEEFLNVITKQIPIKPTKDVLIRVKSYGYDGGQDIEFITKNEVPETDSEVVARLKIEVKHQRQTEKEYQMYLELKSKYEKVQ